MPLSFGAFPFYLRMCAKAVELPVMAEHFRTRRRVEFCDTDAAGIAHFAAMLCYLEQAEHQLLRHVGTSVMVELPDGSHIGWPRVHVECDFRGAAKFGEELDIDVQVLRLGARSVSYGHTISKAGSEIATGKITAVCSRVQRGQPLVSIDIPSSFRELLQPFVRESE